MRVGASINPFRESIVVVIAECCTRVLHAEIHTRRGVMPRKKKTLALSAHLVTSELQGLRSNILAFLEGGKDSFVKPTEEPALASEAPAERERAPSSAEPLSPTSVSPHMPAAGDIANILVITESTCPSRAHECCETQRHWWGLQRTDLRVHGVSHCCGSLSIL